MGKICSRGHTACEKKEKCLKTNKKILQASLKERRRKKDKLREWNVVTMQQRYNEDYVHDLKYKPRINSDE